MICFGADPPKQINEHSRESNISIREKGYLLGGSMRWKGKAELGVLIFLISEGNPRL